MSDYGFPNRFRADLVARKRSSNWELVAGDAREVKLPRKYDVVTCEMLSTWCIVEPQVSVIRAAKERIAASHASIIPSRVFNLIELGYTPFGVGPVQVPTPHLTLMGVRAPTIISLTQVSHVIDFTTGQGVEDNITGAANVKVLVDGLANWVRLTSLVELARGINWYSSDTLMPPMVYPLRESTSVGAGTKMVVGYACRYGHGQS